LKNHFQIIDFQPILSNTPLKNGKILRGVKMTETTSFQPSAVGFQQAETANPLFPIFLKLENFDVLVVGAGNVGLEKASAILNNSPKTRLTIVGERILDELSEFCADFQQVKIIQKSFEPSDLEGKNLVIAATDRKDVNTWVKREAEARGIFANVADTPNECDFYLGSIVQKGSLKIAISTNGKSPTVAKRLKEVLNESLPEELNDLLQKMPKVRERFSGDFTEKVKALNNYTASLVAENSPPQYKVDRHTEIEKIDGKKWRWIATAAMTGFGILLIANVLWAYVPSATWSSVGQSLDSQLLLFIAAGFTAQLFDSMIGLGYGVTTQLFLMTAGVPLAAVSSSIHTAEIFTSGASGYAHYKFGNINRKLFKVLVVPGVLGAVLGALGLWWLGENYGGFIKPILAAYAMILGIRILSRAFIEKVKKKKVKNAGWLALAGGFLDSFGGGGWGPLVTSTLIAKGRTPQYVIGSVSLTEFFVTLASALTFFTVIGVSHWQVIVGLILGGVVAAPIGARLAGKLPVKWMFVAVGCMVIFWSLRILMKILV
jgi:uncharacterized protein